MSSQPLPAINTDRMTSNQLQRAWTLMLVCSLFPTITYDRALPMAQWIFDGRTNHMEKD